MGRKKSKKKNKKKSETETNRKRTKQKQGPAGVRYSSTCFTCGHHRTLVESRLVRKKNHQKEIDSGMKRNLQQVAQESTIDPVAPKPHAAAERDSNLFFRYQCSSRSSKDATLSLDQSTSIKIISRGSDEANKHETKLKGKGELCAKGSSLGGNSSKQKRKKRKRMSLVQQLTRSNKPDKERAKESSLYDLLQSF